MMKMANMPYNNVKTQLCRFWQKDGKCKYGKNCSYAHGDFELRKPYHALPKDATQPYQKTQENEMNGDQKNGFHLYWVLCDEERNDGARRVKCYTIESYWTSLCTHNATDRRQYKHDLTNS